VHPSARAALENLNRVQDELNRALSSRGAVLAASGADLWHELEALPLQLPARQPRHLLNNPNFSYVFV